MDRNDKAIMRKLSQISRVFTFCEGKNYNDLTQIAIGDLPELINFVHVYLWIKIQSWRGYYE